MALTQGARLGPYEILGPLGAGGMGRVYRARDVKLGRAVAIKVLRDDYAGNPAWLARFEREARLLATLNHANIATVHGLDEFEGSRYLAMELVPGQSLAQRLANGPLPPVQTLAIGKQIAEGLEAAHDRGIIHRDLKPGNVMLTPDGKVKILDFGLAKTAEPPVAPADSNAPFEAQTREGVAVGTPGYTAPEQARGEPIDRRSDLWAFGCVLYEMITGRRAFQGATFSDTLATRSPELGLLPSWVPRRVADLLRRCLQPEVRNRMRDAGDARLELEEALAELERPATTQLAAVPPTRLSRRWWPLVAIPIVGLLAFTLGKWLSVPAVRDWSGQLLLGGASQAFGPQVSPDGQWLAFIILHEEQSQVGVMKLDSGEWWVLTRNRDRGHVNNVCWSRDSTRLYFDRFFDVPVGVFSVSPLDRTPEGAREALVVKDADAPQEAADGSLIVGKLDAQGRYRLHRFSPHDGLRAVGPPIELHLGWPSPMRALHAQNAVAFCGKVLDGKAGPERKFYLLDLDREEYRALLDKEVLFDDVPLAVSPHDDFAYTSLEAEDAFRIVRIPLASRVQPETLLTLTTRVWGLDVDSAGRIYLDQVQRPLEVIRFATAPEGAPAGAVVLPVEHIAAPTLWQETGAIGLPLQLPDGRVVLPGKTAGRDRLLMAVPGKSLRPLLDDSRTETAPPLALVGTRRLAFVAGSDKERRLRLADLDDDGVRLEPVDLGVSGEGLTSLAASPDGKKLYYVQSRHVYEVLTDGSTPPKKLEPGDGVAVDPATGDLLIQRFDIGGVHLFRAPPGGGQSVEVPLKLGALRPAPVAIGGGAIHQDGRVLLASTSKDSWYWRPAILNPDGTLQSISVAYSGDVYPAAWTTNDRALGMGYAFHGDLWRLSLADAIKR